MNIEKAEQIHDRILKNIDDRYDKTEGQPAYDFTQPISEVLSESQLNRDEKFELAFARTSKGEWLTMLAEMHGVVRRIDESDDELKVRLFQRTQNPPSGGTVDDYMQWAKEINGVVGVKVVPLWNGRGTVKLIIYGHDSQPVTQELLDLVKREIDPSDGLGIDGKAPIGHTVTVTTVSKVIVNVEIIGLVVKDGYSLDIVKGNISNRLLNYINTVSPSDTITDKYIEALVTTTEGVKNYTDLKLNGANQDIPTTDEQKVALGVITYV